MAGQRFRLRQVFWLDMNKPDEEHLADTIEHLKNERTFASTIRDGIRLVCDLRAGRMDVLFELFPWVRAEFLEYMQSLQPQPTAIDPDIQQQLQRLEKLLVEQGNQPIAPAASSGPKPLNAPRVASPKHDDDTDDVALLKASMRKDMSTDSAENFLKSMMNLQAGFKQ